MKAQPKAADWRKKGSGALRFPILVLLGTILAGGFPATPSLAAHFDNTVSDLASICYDCHTLNANLADDNTSFINASSRTLPTMRQRNGGVTPATFGCTYCHNDPTRTSTMKTAIGPFDSRPSQHPVDRTYARDAFSNITLGANAYTALYLSNWDNTWKKPANQVDCVDCHDAAAGGGLYPNHPIPGSGIRAAGVNPFMLKNTPAMDAGGHAPNSFCLATCHDGTTAPGTAPYTMGHYGWGAYRSTTGGMPDNTLKEHDGTPLKTSKCVDCHETHSTTANPNLMGEARQANLSVDPTNCTNLCHFGAATDNVPFTTKGHGRTGINLLCANCHSSSVSHRDTVNPRRLIGTMDPTWATLVQNLLGNGLDDDFDGVVDGASENAVRYSAESTCSTTCHTDKHFHGGTISTSSGPATGTASCLHCHEPHAKGVGGNIKMTRNKVMGRTITYQVSKTDFYRTDNTSICDNPNCHPKPLGNTTTPGTILYDVSDHRLGGVGAGSDCSGCHSHSSTTGADSFSRNCNSCHTYPGQAVATGSHVLSSVHDRHVNPDSLGGYAFPCSTCHYMNTHNQSGVTGPSDWSAKFAAGNVNIRFDNAWNPKNGNGPKYAGAAASSSDNAVSGVGGTGGCDGLYCHGNSSDAVLWSGNVATGPKWDNTVPAGCGTCHRATAVAPPTTFAHAKHADNTAGYAISCGTCHYATTQDGKTIASRAEHLNRQSRVSFDTTNPLVASGAYGGTLTVGDSGTDTNAKCSNIYCHSPGYRLTSPFDNGALGTPNWNQGPLACNACHGAAGQAGIAVGMPAYANGTPKINSHAKHVSSGYGCQVCHASTTSTGNTVTNRANHVNAAYNAAADNAAHGFAYASPNCSNIACHGGNAAVWGGATLACGSCHLGSGDSDLYQTASATWYANDNVASIDNTEWFYSGHGKTSGNYDVSLHPPANFPGGAGAGDPCLYCHDTAIGHQQASNPFRLKNQTAVSGYSAAGWNATCLVCHSKAQSPPGYGTALGYANLLAATGDRVDTAHYGSKHATDNTGGGYFCWDCHDPHGDRSNSTTGNIYMIQKAAMARSEGIFGYRGTAGSVTGPVTFRSDNSIAAGGDWANAGGTGLCQVCHSGNGTGSATQAKYYTPTSFANHNQDKVCTTCHDHNKNFAASCNACHGEASGPGATGAPPFAPFAGSSWASGAVVDNLSALPGIGDHRTATGVAYSSHETLNCSECHTATPGTDNAHNTGKTNATMTSISTHNWDAANPASWSKGTYDANPGAGTASVVDDSCSNINCHSPYYSANSFRSGTPAPFTRYWLNATLWDCYSCHAYDGRTATSRPAGPDNTMRTGAHWTHVGTNQMACSRCHNVTGYSATSFGGNHKNGVINWSFAGSPNPFSSTPSYSVADNTAAPTDDNSATGHRSWGSCSNLYCHSIGQTSTGGALTGAAGQYAAPAWDNLLTGKCGMCHGGDGTSDNNAILIASGSHTKHVTPQYSYGCAVCHAGLGRGASTHADNMVDLNVNSAMNGTPITAVYSKGNRHAAGTGFGSCSTAYCHGTDNTVRLLSGGANQAGSPNLPTWGDNTTNRCGSCHGATGGAANYPGKASNYPTSGAHARHMSDVRGPVITLCTDCHTSETSPTHADGKVDLRVSKDNTAATTFASTHTCDPCHGTGVATAKANWAAVADVDCLTCHEGTVPAYSYANGTGRVAPNEAGDNTTYGASVRGHNRPTSMGNYPVSNNPAGNRLCASCHDVASIHIDNVAGTTYAQLRLLTGTVNGVAVDNTISGLCAACHTNAGSPTASTNKVNTHGNAGYPGNLENKASSTPPSPGAFTTTCDQCHEPHGMVNTAAGPNIWMMNPTIRINGSTTATNVAFTSRTGANSFNGTRGTAPLAGYAGVNELCVVCHAATNAPYSPMTYNVGGWHNAPAYAGDETGKDCSGCHSHNQDGSNATVDGLMPLACNGCHSFPGISGGTWTKAMSSTHVKHVGDNTGVSNSRGYQCTICHFSYNHNQNNVLPGGAWPGTYYTLVDIRFDNALNPPNANGPLYNGAAASASTAPGNGGTGACAGIFCHGNAATQSTWGGTTTATPPKWDNTVPAGCGTCHGASASLAQGSHPEHIQAAYGPGMAAFSVGGSCSEGTGCHTAYGLSPTSYHVDGLVGFHNVPADNAQVGLASTTVCQKCHSTYASTAGVGDNLVRTRSNWDNTSYTVPCLTCHNGSAGQQGTQNMDGSGHLAPNIEAAWATLGGHGTPSIDNASTTTDNGVVDQVPPVRCETCHDELGMHIGTAKDTVNPYRLDNTLMNFTQAGGADRSCLVQCHSTSSVPARHSWIVNGTWATAKDNTTNTHPSTMQVVPQPGAPSAETVNKAMWYQVPSDPLMPLLADLASKSPPARSAGSLLVCVTCHDPHGVGTAPTAARTFSGTNTMAAGAKKMLRYNASGATPTPLCAKCHK